MSTAREYENLAPPTYSPLPVSQPTMATPDNATVVKTAPAPLTYMYVISPSPQNYLILNLFTLLCCCFLIGFIGLMFSLQVDSEWNRGNHQRAYDAARNARNWGIAGIVTGFFFAVMLAIVTIIYTA